MSRSSCLDRNEATCAICCSCMLTCGILVGSLLTVFGITVAILGHKRTETVDLNFHKITLEQFGVISACVGAAMIVLTLTFVCAARCLRHMVRKQVHQYQEIKTPLVHQGIVPYKSPPPYSYYTLDPVQRTKVTSLDWTPHNVITSHLYGTK